MSEDFYIDRERKLKRSAPRRKASRSSSGKIRDPSKSLLDGKQKGSRSRQKAVTQSADPMPNAADAWKSFKNWL